MPILTVQITTLNSWTGNPRTLSEQHIQQLTDSIRAQGLLNPPTAAEINGVTYVIAGQARLAAMKRIAHESGQTQWTVNHQGQMTEQAALALSTIENTDREPMTPLQEARAYQALNTHGTEELASRIGRTVQHVRNRLNLLQLQEDEQAALEQGSINLGGAQLLRTLPPNSPLRAEIAAQLRSGQSVSSVAERLAQVREIPVERAIFTPTADQINTNIFGQAFIARTTFFDAQRAELTRLGQPWSETIHPERDPNWQSCTPDTPGSVTWNVLDPRSGNVSVLNAIRKPNPAEQRTATETRHDTLRRLLNQREHQHLALAMGVLGLSGLIKDLRCPPIMLEGLNLEEATPPEVLQRLMACTSDQLLKLQSALLIQQLAFTPESEQLITHQLELAGREEEIYTAEQKIRMLSDEQVTAAATALQLTTTSVASARRQLQLGGYAVGADQLHPALRFGQP